jgi:hypothetical protein
MLLIIGLSIALTGPSLAGEKPTTKAACKEAGRIWDHKTKTCSHLHLGEGARCSHCE